MITHTKWREMYSIFKDASHKLLGLTNFPNILFYLFILKINQKYIGLKFNVNVIIFTIITWYFLT